MGGLYNLCGVMSYDDEEGVQYKKEGGVLCKDMGLLLLCRRHWQREEGDVLMTVMILCCTPAAADGAEGVPCHTAGVGEEGHQVLKGGSVVNLRSRSV